MRRLALLPFAALSLPLIMASCGQPAALPVAATGPLMKVEMTASGVFRAQGLTSDAPVRHYDVTVRNSAGKVVAFNGTTYDPTGAGTTTLTLNSGNNYQQVLLLPKGEYTFENKVKDDASGATLIAYGPASENPGTIDENSSLIRLKSHAVFSGANSSLAPSMTLNALYTDATFNLGLNLKTATIATGSGDVAATVPTSDIGAVAYTLGNATDGVLNGAGSKIGVNVTARGTDIDSMFNVTATFKAWVQDDGTDTASYQTVTENFDKQIQTNLLTVDTVMPSLTLNPVSASTGSAVNLTGTVGDDVQVNAIRAFVQGNLVASSDPTEQSGSVSALTGDSAGNWTGTWTPAVDGNYDLVVIAEDSSGNETRVEQTITAITPPPVTYDLVAPAYDGSEHPLNVVAGQVNTIRAKYDGNATYLHLWMATISGSGNFSVTVTAPDGTVMNADGDGYVEFPAQYQAGIYTIKLTSDFDGQIDMEIHTH